MMILGLLITLLGFLISVMSLGMASSVGARMAMVTVGIFVSLFGIIALINKAFQKNAIWKR